MYLVLHYLLMACYHFLPIAALLVACYQSRKTLSLQPVGAFFLTCISAVILGTCIVIIYAVLLRGDVPFLQILVSWYFITSLLLMIGLLRWVFRQALGRLTKPPADPTAIPRRVWGRNVIHVLQSLAIAAIGLPFLVGTMLVNRVRVHQAYSPQNTLGLASEHVNFAATDGMSISGWWVPAQLNPSKSFFRRHPYDSRTVLLCGGLTDDFEDQAGLVGLLARSGFNVLFVSLRGHDDSGGQWTTFGLVERLDILGAVRWLQQMHPDQSQRIDAVGGGIGGAAVIAAATDTDPLSQSISSVAVLGTYARFDVLTQNLFNANLPRPITWWLLHTIVPVASANTGSDLVHFAPADLASQLWPRPILILHGRADVLFPPSEAQDLFEHASYPKEMIWLMTDHAGAYHSRQAAAALLEFLQRAAPSPVI